MVQHEPANFVEPETAGLFAAIGVKKGKKFVPDARMKAILTDTMAVANATARAILFAPRDERTRVVPLPPKESWFDGTWKRADLELVN